MGAASATLSTAPPAASTTTTLSPAATILKGMTLRQKAAQVLLLGFEGSVLMPTTTDLLAYGPPGGLLIMGYNVTGPDQLQELIFALQEGAASSGLPVGLLIAVDQEGGTVQRIHEGAPDLPPARELGDNSSPTEAGRLASETAQALLELGVNMNLAPVADVVSDPRSFLYSRTFGDDPRIVADFVRAITQSFTEEGLITVAKHFPGHGSAPGDTHGEAVVSDADETTFETVHLPPFRAALTAGAECVMVAHLIADAYDPKEPASLSPAVIEGLLRGDLGFTGVVVSDDLEMAAVSEAGAAADGDAEAGAAAAGDAEDPGEIAVRALQAGCDLLISTGPLERQKAMIDAIEGAVLEGTLDRERLDQAVSRVVELKLRHGITPLRVP